MPLIIFILSLLLPFEQDNQVAGIQADSNRIVRDSLVDVLVSRHREIHMQLSGMHGFRVHIYTDSGNRSKLRTDKEKAAFDERYPLVNSYISHVEPNYRLRVGDFRTRLDALRFLNEISRHYPGAYIVVDRINFPPLASDIMKIKEDKIRGEEDLETLE